MRWISMITQIQTTEFAIVNRVSDGKQSLIRGLQFEVGDEVLVIPYTIGTVIRRANEKHFLIETDALNIRERTVQSYNDYGKLVRFPRFGEDKAIICKFDEMPYSELVVDDFEIAPVRKLYSSVVQVNRDYKTDYHTALLYDKKLTKVKKIDDEFKVMSYSPSIISEYPTWRMNRPVLNVPNYWLGQEVVLIRW